MPLLVADNITKYYGAELVLEEVSLAIAERDRVGLIGANGTGKTTLCKVMLRELRPDEGQVHTARGATVGYLEQAPSFPPGQSLWDAAMGVFGDMREMEGQLREYEQQMAEPRRDDLDAVMERHERVRAEYERAGGYEYETRAATVMTGVGFAESDFPRRLGTFSGGEKSRAALAALLLRQPDLLLLDEPTNHLDIQGMEWLEEHLRTYPGAVVVISHDRRFLNNAVGRIAELAHHELTEYSGGYDDYVRQKEELLLNYERVYEQQQRERERQLAYIRWALGTGQEKRVRAAKSRLKLLDKVDWLDAPAGQRRKANLRFTPRIRGGQEIAELADVAVGYDGAPLVRGVSMFLRRGDRVGIVGPNGCGKTTLLKVLLQQMEALDGGARLGASVEVGYFSQAGAELKPDNTVMEEFAEVVPDATPGELRHLLGRFLFMDDDVFKGVGQLSQGQQSRLALAKLIMTRPTFLVLDEPTNHLDIDSRGALETALREYSGTVLVVSHDRYFLDAVVSRVLVFRESTAQLHDGNYSSYVTALRREEEERLQAEAASQRADRKARVHRERRERRGEKGQQGAAAPPSPWELKRRGDELEMRAGELETRIAKIEALLGDPIVCADEKRARALSVEYERLDAELRDTYEAWEDVLRAG
ncbi:MAG: ABC-F family ATP-binding cassette domain-containing protein [Armatimonadota bacterium]|jgi:ATP-binding cassette subfamily F protein 3